ncbi:CRISPR-associated helicase Cas3', partial [Clostridium butyricum]|uniref:CRISPR-associated helicase Cas3' n=1 Tax=Clostridium butyricum TaxID=1492 RepID=UPI003D339D72
TGRKIFRKLLINTIAFHDIDKINPNFQNAKMDNLLGKYAQTFPGIGSEHSLISSVLYIDYFIEEILSLSNEDGRLILMSIMMFNAYAISRHHSDLDNFNEFLSKFNEGEKAIEIINTFKENDMNNIYRKNFVLSENRIVKVCGYIKKKYFNEADDEKSIYLYTYERLIYSLLVCCDFYATSEFMNKTIISDFGEIRNIDEFYKIYKDTDVYKSIREYEDTKYEKSKDLSNEKNINVLRTEMFLDAERELLKNIDENVYFLEAPTGSGKSNTAFNLSFKLFEEDKNLKKIYYVYPFNTLVEQNLNILNKTFGNNKAAMDNIAVINSIYPIKEDNKYVEYDSGKNGDEKDFSYKYYEKALLNRQFLNYPVILTTHVSLFSTMFGENKEDAFAFHQLANSVIVLDEIQSYKNTIWTEIISFLKGFAKILNIKVIIMSATLPDLNMLAINTNSVCSLIKDREKYFSNPQFKDRVIVNYDLIDSGNPLQDLYEHVLKNSSRNKKILIEFIKKQSAYEFFKMLNEEELDATVLLMTGDDNSIERDRIIKELSSNESEENGVILVATQVIEAGVDIDMDIGYKDISKLDSDEQFMGRINRSCRKNGEVYFFNLDKTDKIYKDDFRVNKDFSLLDDKMREILKNKKFSEYYKMVLEMIKKSNNLLNDDNIHKFFKENVWMLNFKEVSQRMKLIEDNNWNMSVYLARNIDEDNIHLNGIEVWNEYKKLLHDSKMNYSEKQVKLSNIRSKMSYFIYEIKKNFDLPYNDKIGELYYIENGEKYFENGKLDKEKFSNEVGMFIEL